MVKFKLGRRLCLLPIIILTGIAFTLAMRGASAESPGGTPVVSNQAGTVTITFTHSITSPVDLSVREPGVEPMPVSVAFSQTEPITVTVLIDTVAGGGDADTKLVSDTLQEVVASLRPTDFITIVPANSKVLVLAPVFRWIQKEAYSSDLKPLLVELKLRKPSDIFDLSIINDANLRNLLDSIQRVTTPGHFVILVTNGFQLGYRQLDANSVLIQLRASKGEFLKADAENGALLEYSKKGKLIKIDDSELISKTRVQLSSARISTWVMTYSTSIADKHEAQLIINGTPFTLTIPAMPSVPEAVRTATTIPATAALATATITTTTQPNPTEETSTPSLLPYIIIAGILVTGGTLIGGLLLERRSHPYLLIDKRRIRLHSPMWLGRDQWPTVHDDSLAVDHAQITRDTRLGWIIMAQQYGNMKIDGLRSRKNRLRTGTVISLGEASQAVCTFIDPAQSPHSGAKGKRS